GSVNIYPEEPEEINLFEPDFPENRTLLPGNEAIMASAGTGKTFSLAMRYISLLHAGVAPGRILASTFTKKAAGEIYDKIAEELISLASSEKKAAELVKNFPVLANGRFDSARAGGILGRLLKSKDRLQISTLDSFFVNIIRAFPLECGIFGELSIMEESDSRSRVNTLLSLLRELRQEDRKEIMETVKEASFGENKKYLYGTVKELVFDLYDKFLICPDAKYWCSEKLRKLIPGSYFSNKEKLQKIADTYPAHLENFLSDHKKNKNTENLYEIFTGILADALKAEDNPKADKKTLAIWEKFSAVYPTFPITEPGMDSITISYNKEKYLLQGKFYQHTVILMRQILFCNIRSLIKRNEALWRILDLFNRKYALLVRSAGKIAFSDIPYLLRPDENNAETGLALPFSDRAGIEERLDEKTDHYLIDEFQDTSDSQWNAISRLAEEAITDSDGGRSFFYVGDIKQSIYQWRYGNPGLFDMILKKFPESTYGERGIRKNTLIKSYRSSNEVLNMVNVVFMNPAAVLNIKNAEADEKKIIYNALT
ncbi:MAG: UvrD-helicase domain-containing protein, partial [Lentisphaeria bacterium]|nr:UvrD-helicase domain-containing protein [Lentisphaeria bacterium]